MSIRPDGENFDLLIVRDADNYRVRASSQAGEFSHSFSPPFSVEELDGFISKLNDAPKSQGDYSEAIKDFGGRLFATIFKGQIYSLLSISRDRAATRGAHLRIRLNLTAVPELADLPWEYLYEPDLNAFFALSENTPLVRYLDMPGAIRPLVVSGPLRVLVMVSNARGYMELAVEREWDRLNESLESLINDKLVKLQRVRATVNELQDQLQKETFHVFHFIGHGGFDREVGGYLIMEDEEGNGFSLNGEGLGMLLHDYNLRLVVLNACEGARTSLTDTFAGTAQSLVQAGVPAVIAMQFKVSDDAAVTFAGSFYKALAAYRPLDGALASARQAIKGQGNDVEWATPALYLRSDDGRIFEKGSRGKDDNKGITDPSEIYYRTIIKRLQEGTVIPFLGPSINRCGREQDEGYSEGGYPPDDGEIAEYLARSLTEPGLGHDLARVSQRIATLASMETLSSELRSLLDVDYEPTSLHRLLAAMPRLLRDKGCAPPYQLIVTSNYDDVLERAFKEEGEEYDLIHYEAEGEARGRFYHTPFGGIPKLIRKKTYDDLSLDQRTIILKFHGAVNRAGADSASYVITEDHYIDYLTHNESLPTKIKGLLTKSHFLFLGYRLRDWNLRVIFHRLWGDETLRHDSWVIQPDPDPVDRKFWNKRNVHPLDVRLRDFVQEIRTRLEQL